jgi:nucleotide-binding universal stress UspA family protein
MRRFEKILIACFLDERDETTLRHVGRFARAAGSREVILAHVIDVPDLQGEGVQDLWEPNREAATAALGDLAARHTGLLGEGTKIECRLLEGSFVLELARLAAEAEVDLVAVATRQNGALSASKEDALRLLRKVPCSMFVVPDGSDPCYERILVPMDFSLASQAALDVAQAVATMSPKARISGLHIYSAPVGYRKTGQDYDTAAERMRELAERRWVTTKDRLNARGAAIHMRFQRATGIAEAILENVEELDSDLVVMSSHGLTKPAALLLGRNPELVFARTDRPFLCVKKRGEVIGLLEALLRFLSLKEAN